MIDKWAKCTINVGDIVKFRPDYGEPEGTFVVKDQKEYIVLKVKSIKDQTDYYTLVFIGEGIAYFWWRFDLISNHAELKSVETLPEYEGLFE